MLDITSPTGAYLVDHSCDHCILMSPRLAIITTSAAVDTWTKLLTQTWHDDPNNCATSLRMRDSSHARNKQLASITATKEQISAARARKGHQEVPCSVHKPLTLRATLDLPANIDADSSTWK